MYNIYSHVLHNFVSIIPYLLAEKINLTIKINITGIVEGPCLSIKALVIC